MTKYTSYWASIVERCAKAETMTNHERRVTYSDFELLKMDLEASGKYDIASLSEVEAEEVKTEVEDIRKSLRLKRAPRERSIWSLLWLVDFTTRFIGVPLGFTCAGIFAALPLILLKACESHVHAIKVRDEMGREVELSVAIRRWIVGRLLSISGLSMEVQGLDEHFFAHEKLLVCFQHNSSADPLIVARSCPTSHFCFGKKELFLMPFMGWFGLAIGGISIDRGNRDRSIAALNIATEASAKNKGKCCICVAPEGTRSKCGNLLDFKKGPFHIWEDLDGVPIVPMVTYGNFDLYPTGSWVNTPGKIIVRYLRPIMKSEAKTRDEMQSLLRRRMLEALRDAPKDLGRPLTWYERFESLFTLASLVGLVYAAWQMMLYCMVDMPSSTGWLYFAYFVVGVTVMLHGYNVYIATYLDRLSRQNTKKSD